MRYFSTADKCQETISLDEYIKLMIPDQKKIYYISGTEGQPERVMESPFMEPFKDAGIPVLVF